MLIVAVSITSRENSELINVLEFNIPKHPIIKSIIAGKSITVSNSILYGLFNVIIASHLAG
jgi:hypothetical protein